MTQKAAILGTQRTGEDACEVLRQAGSDALQHMIGYQPKQMTMEHEPEPLSPDYAQECRNRGITNEATIMCLKYIVERRYMRAWGYEGIHLPADITFYGYRR